MKEEVIANSNDLSRSIGSYRIHVLGVSKNILFAKRTRIFFPHTRLTPTQNIRIDPTMDKFPRAKSVISGLISHDKAVTLP